MHIPTKLAFTLLAILALTITSARAADELDAETKARVERFEKGPATIDISKYPDGIKENYETFSQKCTQCHKLSRPINSDYALPDEWSRYVKRMMHKPGSGINATDGKKIYEFLVYDSSIRKKAMVDRETGEGDCRPTKAGEAKKLKEVHDAYDK